VNVAGDNYYQDANASSDATELTLWTSSQTDVPTSVAARVAGAIPLTNPTFAQIDTWAALKWESILLWPRRLLLVSCL
jgi:hypothetical protein